MKAVQYHFIHELFSIFHSIQFIHETVHKNLVEMYKN